MADLQKGKVEKYKVTKEMRDWLKERKKIDTVAKMIQQKFLEVKGQAQSLKTLMRAISINYSELDANSPKIPTYDLPGMDFTPDEEKNVAEAESEDFMMRR